MAERVKLDTFHAGCRPR